MRIFSRLKTGLQLARGSLSVLRDNPGLLWFPLVGGVAGLAYVLVLLGSVFALGDVGSDALLYAALFVFYVGSTFIASFFTAALMHATRGTFHGEEPNVRESMAAAWRNKGTLLAWAVIAAVVGVIIRALEDSNELVAQVVAVVFSLGWAVMTYFVVPVVVFEDVSVTEMFSRSGGLVKDIWGESLGAETGVSLVTFLLVLVGVAVAAATFFVVPGTGPLSLAVVALVGGGAILLAFLIGSALTGIAKTALYVYATEDETPHYFSGMDFGR